MGKLVVYLPDGTTHDVPLAKERVTIGRRADNDVCLPYPAVSGEHAQVVTILDDSFLEDLGSTNGTLVNGKTIVKHFLADYDQIDIGRQKLTYVSDNGAKVESVTPEARLQVRGLTEKVEPARPVPQIEVPAAGDPRPQFAARSTPLASPAPAAAAPPPMVRIEDLLPPKPPPPSLVVPAGPAAPAATPPAPTAAVAPAPAPASRNGPSVKVLSGASQGRIVPFPGPELTVGRVGVQVAIVRKVTAGYLLIPVEGKEPPRINGAAVAPEGSPLHPGDTFEVAGVRLELSVHA